MSRISINILFGSDAAIKQFITQSKNYLPQNHMICNIKNAIDLAFKTKIFQIKSVPSDPATFPADLISTILSNWINHQLRKPTKISSTKKLTSKRASKASPVELSTSQIDIDSNFPIFVYIYDYPRTTSQFKLLCDSATPAICCIQIDISNTDTEKRLATTSPEWVSSISKYIPSLKFAQINEETYSTLISSVSSIYNSYISYQHFFADYRFIQIPQYPIPSVPIPQLISDKPSAKINPLFSSTTDLLSKNNSLKSAFQSILLRDFSNFLKNSLQSPNVNFQHHLELYKFYPLPSILAQIISFVPNFKDPILFTIRDVSYRTQIPFQMILDTLILKNFNDLIGYNINERRHKEFIPFNLVSNLMTPLIYSYDHFKWKEFAGKILIAFYNDIPENLPISNKIEKFKLPIFESFGKWLTKQKNDFPLIKENNNKQTQTGKINLYKEIEDEFSSNSITRYYCECGLRVDTYPIQIQDGIISSLSFDVSFSSFLRFSYHISQSIYLTKENEENIETKLQVRGVLGRDLDFFYNHSLDHDKFVLSTSKSQVEFDVNNNRIIINGVKNEIKRIILNDGTLIKYCPNPIIYSPNGTIQQYVNNEWNLIDRNGNMFNKKEDKWIINKENKLNIETYKTYFTSRKVIKRSDGFTIIKDNDETIILFPDGTKYNQSTKTYSYDDIPDVQICDDKMIIKTFDINVTINNNHNCKFELKNNCVIEFIEEIGNLLITFDQLKSAFTMIDVLSGDIAIVDSRKYVYYLNEDLNWSLGKHLCSKKEIIQHFKDGDFVERLELITNVDKEELETIINNGHEPRMFVIDKENESNSIYELMSNLSFNKVIENASEQIPSKDDFDIVLWFDTEPKTFREMRITTKITNEQKDKIFAELENQKQIEKIERKL